MARVRKLRHDNCVSADVPSAVQFAVELTILFDLFGPNGVSQEHQAIFGNLDSADISKELRFVLIIGLRNVWRSRQFPTQCNSGQKFGGDGFSDHLWAHWPLFQ
jgi:hypothetical protein